MILSLDKPLVPIEDFAVRQGVPVDVIQACGDLGIVKLRKKHGRVYVVDVPITDMPDGSFDEQKLHLKCAHYSQTVGQIFSEPPDVSEDFPQENDRCGGNDKMTATNITDTAATDNEITLDVLADIENHLQNEHIKTEAARLQHKFELGVFQSLRHRLKLWRTIAWSMLFAVITLATIMVILQMEKRFLSERLNNTNTQLESLLSSLEKNPQGD